MSSGKWNSGYLSGSGLGTYKFKVGWGFFCVLSFFCPPVSRRVMVDLFVLLKTLIACLNLSFSPYPTVNWKASQF